MLDGRFGRSSTQDYRNTNVFLTTVNVISGTQHGNNQTQLYPDQAELFVLDQVTKYISEEFLPTISPTGSSVVLMSYDSARLPTGVHQLSTNPTAMNHVANLGVAMNVIVEPPNIKHTLTYLDANDAERVQDLNALSASDPFELVCDDIGYLDVNNAWLLSTLIARGQLRLWITNKTLGVRAVVTKKDSPAVRRAIEDNDAKVINLILTSPTNAVPATAFHYLTKTQDSGYDLINLPIRRQLLYQIDNGGATQVLTKWTDVRGEATLEKRFFNPSLQTRFDQVFEPTDIDGDLKRDIQPTCFFNPLIRMAEAYYYGATTLFSELASTIVMGAR